MGISCKKEKFQSDTILRNFTSKKDIAKDDIILKELNNAIGSPEIQNIGLSGNFGSGKSSLVDSYILSYTAENTVKISFADIIEKQKEKEKEYDSKTFENDLLTKLKYSKKERFSSNVFFAFCITYILCLSLALFFSPVHSLLISLFSNEFKEKYRLVCYWFLFLSYIPALIHPVYYMATRIKLNTFRIFGAEANISFQDNVNVFSNIEAIVNVIRKKQIKTIFWEDIDRCKDASMFNKLRNLNLTLNGYLSYKVTFIYVITDDIFIDSLTKTKFLDIDIPCNPILSANGSIDQLCALFYEKDNPNSVSIDLLRLVSTFIYDMRIVNDIYNHYQLFLRGKAYEKMKNMDRINDRIFAFMIFKILYPLEYSKIQTGTSILDRFFESFEKEKNKNYDLNNLTTSMKNKIISELYLLKNKILDDYNGTEKKYKDITVARYNSGENYPNGFPRLSLNNCEYFLDSSVPVDKKYAELENQIVEKYTSTCKFNTTVSDYIMKYNSNLVKNIFNSKVSSDLKDYNLDCIKLLLENDFIKQDFQYFYYSGNGEYINPEDLEFINKVKNNEPLDALKEYKCKSVERVLLELEPVEKLARSKVYNYSLTEHIFTSKKLKNYTNAMELNDTDLEFLSYLFENSVSGGKFLEILFDLRTDAFEKYSIYLNKVPSFFPFIYSNVGKERLLREKQVFSSLLKIKEIVLFIYDKEKEEGLFGLLPKDYRYNLTQFEEEEEFLKFIISNNLYVVDKNTYPIIFSKYYKANDNYLEYLSLQNTPLSKEILNNSSFYDFYYDNCKQEKFEYIQKYILSRTEEKRNLFLKNCDYIITDIVNLFDVYPYNSHTKLYNIFAENKKIYQNVHNMFQLVNKGINYNAYNLKETLLDKDLNYTPYDFEFILKYDLNALDKLSLSEFKRMEGANNFNLYKKTYLKHIISNEIMSLPEKYELIIRNDLFAKEFIDDGVQKFIFDSLEKESIKTENDTIISIKNNNANFIMIEYLILKDLIKCNNFTKRARFFKIKLQNKLLKVLVS